jgi:hypothetical protein
MILGIVGSEAAKFTAETENLCCRMMEDLIKERQPTGITSGACHLGGVDIWAADLASIFGLDLIEHPPERLNWDGYRARNIKIAETADEVVCFTVKDLPAGFLAGGWERYCYHCGTDSHIKSGGCWTTKYARKIGKPGRTIVVDAS